MKPLFELLQKSYGRRWPWPRSGEFYDPFKNLVITILSQNTSDVNSMRAYESLARKFSVTPRALARADVRAIGKAIKIGGLYNIKARRIKQLARIILRDFGGDAGKLLKLSQDEARERLMKMPGIGNKTADVFLAICGKRHVIPIDTHLNLIAKRLGIVRPKANYKDVQNAYNQLMPAGKRFRAHVLLIMLGKDYCRARNPRCSECPLLNVCKFGMRAIQK